MILSSISWKQQLVLNLFLTMSWWVLLPSANADGDMQCKVLWLCCVDIARHSCYVYPQFIEAVKPKLEDFFVQCILPNLLVPHKSSTLILAMDVNLSQPTDNSAGAIIWQEVFCYCQQGEDKRPMIGCDNPKYPYQWFHVECLGVLEGPCTDTWTRYCPDCSIHFPLSNKQ